MKKGFSNNPSLILSVSLYLFDKKGFEKINLFHLFEYYFKENKRILEVFKYFYDKFQVTYNVKMAMSYLQRYP